MKDVQEHQSRTFQFLLRISQADGRNKDKRRSLPAISLPIVNRIGSSWCSVMVWLFHMRICRRITPSTKVCKLIGKLGGYMYLSMALSCSCALFRLWT